MLLSGAGSESKKDTIDEEEDDDDDDDDVPDLVENFDEASKNEEKAAEAKGKLLLCQTTPRVDVLLTKISFVTLLWVMVMLKYCFLIGQ